MSLRCWLLYQRVSITYNMLLNKHFPSLLKFLKSFCLIEYVSVNRRDVSGTQHIEQFFSQVVTTHVPFLTLIISYNR
jgi:hypothetical protein